MGDKGMWLILCDVCLYWVVEDGKIVLLIYVVIVEYDKDGWVLIGVCCDIFGECLVIC